MFLLLLHVKYKQKFKSGYTFFDYIQLINTLYLKN